MQERKTGQFVHAAGIRRNQPSGEYTVLASRNPRLLLLLPGLLLLRLAARTLAGLLFHEPPRLTRLEPLLPSAPIHSSAGDVSVLYYRCNSNLPNSCSCFAAIPLL